MLRSFFEERKIEYYAVLDYADCNVIAERIMNRESFTPRSVIVYLLPYYAGETVNISRYAAARDYHWVIAKINAELGDLLSEKYPGAHYRGYGDHSPIDERHAAAISGLGIRADSTLLINEKYGTYVFIADMITDIDPSELGAVTPGEIRECLHCGKCLAACPTGILRGECPSCLSAVTQRRGRLEDGEIEMMRRAGTVWGCDVCQTVCPYNENPTHTPLDEFKRDRIEHLTRESLDAMSDEEFASRAFSWRGRAVITRNLDALSDENE